MLSAMIARWLRAPVARGLLVAAAVAAGASTACDKVPLTAPTQSFIQLFATGSAVPPGGSLEIVATVTEAAGTPVQNGTVVSFITSLGRMDPAEARTHNGKASARLIADGRSGVATITAFSGAAESATLEVPVGAAAIGTLLVSADPARLPAGGGTSQITARARDLAGNPLSGVAVTFSTTAGSVTPTVATTDAGGDARATLTTTREATVSAQVAQDSAEVTVAVDEAPGLTVAITPDPPVEGRTTQFAITVTVPAGGTPVERLEIRFGDGDSRTLTIPSAGGTTNVSHVYGQDGTFTVTVTVVDALGGRQTQQSVITVVDAPAIPLTLTATPQAPTAGQIITFAATPSLSGGISIARYEWDFGDGTQRTTTSGSTTHAYGTAGSRIVRVVAIGSDGSEGQATLVVNVS